MKITAQNVQEYLNNVPTDKNEAIEQLRKTILKNLPKGFEECLNYGMIGYVVPHSIFAAGYHCDPKLPLSFMAIAAQKNFIALYHMGIYANETLHNWFVAEYEKLNIGKLDMGKSCIRFKKPEKIPFNLIAQLVQKMSVSDWITIYQKMLDSRKR